MSVIGSGLASSRSGRGLAAASMRKRRNASHPGSALCQSLCRNGAGGELGDMAVMGDEARNPPPSEPCAQAIDQAIELGLILVAAETDLLVRAGLGDDDREPRQIEAEARIDLVAQRSEPLDEERADRLRIPDRTGGAGGDALDRAIGAEECKLEAPRAVAARRQRRFQPLREPLDDGEHVLLAGDRLVKALLGEIRCNREAR